MDRCNRAEIHAIRAEITAQAGDESHALTLAADRMAREAAERFGMQWQSVKPPPNAITTA